MRRARTRSSGRRSRRDCVRHPNECRVRHRVLSSSLPFGGCSPTQHIPKRVEPTSELSGRNRFQDRAPVFPCSHFGSAPKTLASCRVQSRRWISVFRNDRGPLPNCTIGCRNRHVRSSFSLSRSFRSSRLRARDAKSPTSSCQHSPTQPHRTPRALPSPDEGVPDPARLSAQIVFPRFTASQKIEAAVTALHGFSNHGGPQHEAWRHLCIVVVIGCHVNRRTKHCAGRPIPRSPPPEYRRQR